ncbi:MAG: carbon-nitrogen family hydrolase [Phototrophicaceae bacterium]
MPKLTVSLAQMNVVAGDVSHNSGQFERMVAEASRRKSSLVVLPELFMTGYVLPEAKKRASEMGKGVFEEISQLASKGNIAITGSILEKRGLEASNSMPFFAPNGRMLGVYRKMHLFRLFDEDQYLAPGQSPLTLDLPWGTTGLAICYDLRFPEIFRRYAIKEQAKMIIISAEWPLVRIGHWRALLVARAIENQCFVIACNAAGDTGDTVMGGHSMIIDPWGRIVMEAGEKPQLITAEIELDEVKLAREKIPVFEDLRRDIYDY